MARCLIKKQYLRLLVERARQQDSLLLPARQATSYVSDQCVIPHRHALDLAVDCSHLRAMLAGKVFNISCLIYTRTAIGGCFRQRRPFNDLAFGHLIDGPNNYSPLLGRHERTRRLPTEPSLAACESPRIARLAMNSMTLNAPRNGQQWLKCPLVQAAPIK